MSADLGEKFVWLSKTFSGNFFRAVYPSWVQVKFKGKRKKSLFFFFTFLGLKDCVGFKDRRTMSRYQVEPFAIFTNFGFNLSVKVCARENPYKNCEFWLVFSAKNPVKSDTLALVIEGKNLNLMFLAFYIPVYPLRIGYE